MHPNEIVLLFIASTGVPLLNREGTALQASLTSKAHTEAFWRQVERQRRLLTAVERAA